MIMKLGSIPNGKRLIEKNERDGGGIHSSKQGGGEGREGVAPSSVSHSFNPFSHLLERECGKISLGELWDKST